MENMNGVGGSFRIVAFSDLQFAAVQPYRQDVWQPRRHLVEATTCPRKIPKPQQRQREQSDGIDGPPVMAVQASFGNHPGSDETVLIVGSPSLRHENCCSRFHIIKPV